MSVHRLGWIVFCIWGMVITPGLGAMREVVAAPSPLATEANPLAADRLFQQGVEQFHANQLQAAIASWQRSLALYQTLQDQAATATTLKNLSAAHLALREYPQVIGYLQQSLTLARSQSDPQAELTILMTLADAYASQGEYTKAIQEYETGLTLAQSQGNPQTTAILLGNAAIAYKALGNYTQAITANQQALTVLKELDHAQLMAQVLNNLGNVYEAVGDYDTAIAQYQHSLKLVRQIPDPVGESLALNNLGGVYANLGQYKQAIAVLQPSLEISQRLHQPDRQASTLINLGSAYHALNQRDQAISAYQQALDLAQKTGDRRRASEALGSLGILYETAKEYPQAIQFQEQSLALTRQLGDPAAIGRGLNNLGHTLFKAGKLAEAAAQLRAAVQLMDALRPQLSDRYQVSIFDTQIHTYSLLQQILVAANQPEAALEAAEQGRARAFVELLAKKDRATGRQPATRTDPAAPITIADIRQIAQQQQATLVEYAIVADDDFTFRGKQRAREAQLLIWVVQPTGKVGFRQVNLRPLWEKDFNLNQLVTAGRCLVPIDDCEEMGDRLRDTLPPAKPRSSRSESARSRPSSENYPGLRKLHELLIAPIADLLPTNPTDRVIFIPQESLFLLPFAALQAADGSYLIEHHTVLTAPSIQVLALTQHLRQHQTTPRPSSALVVGNPIMPTIRLTPTDEPFQLSELPGAEQEAIAIAKLLNTKAVIGKQATKAQILQQLPSAKIIHLATHGLLEYGTQESSLQGIGMPGAIALAPDQQDDGLLTASEIADLQLQAELVVLSACDTGQGRITGDGVIGLSRALITAGVPSVMVSLWAVDDNSTSTLMQAFYQNLPTVTDKAQALRQAMLTTMKEHPSPMDWAAFTLIGEAD